MLWTIFVDSMSIHLEAHFTNRESKEKNTICFSLIYLSQNVVMLMSDIVDWLIPDIPKDISLQIHKEKILLVDLFMKEEQGKIQNLERRLSSEGKENCSRSNNNSSSSSGGGGTTAHQRSGLHTNSSKSL